MPKPKPTEKNNGATLGFEAELWQLANKLRGHMDAAEYKNVALGLIFLKYITRLPASTVSNPRRHTKAHEG